MANKLPPPPINQSFHHEDEMAHYWKRWFVDMHKTVQDQQSTIEELVKVVKSQQPQT